MVAIMFCVLSWVLTPNSFFYIEDQIPHLTQCVSATGIYRCTCQMASKSV